MGGRLMLWRSVAPLIVMCGFLAGCDPITLTALGVGSAAGVQHTLSGIAYKTFSLPLPKVRSAVRVALSKMSIKVDAPQKTENGEVIKARSADRDIEIELEAISPNTTRMRSIVSKGIFKDAATATEIILQTEKAAGAS
jgi:hypothetical protein